jgi:phosphinothricin acetyltransferase
MIRPARDSDGAAIAALWNPVIRDTAITFSSALRSPQDIAAMIADKAAAGHAFLVAEAAGGLAGFAAYGQFRSGPGYARAMEHSIVLAPQARGQGLGRALLAATEDHARAGGAHCLLAGVSAENPAGRAFHAALGYRLIATLPEVGWKFGRHIDLWLMQKFLS